MKEENNFNWDEAEMDHYRGRASRDSRGGRFPRRNQDWDNRGGRGGRGGRGVWKQENKWKNGRAVPNGNIPPFMANSGPPPPQMENIPFMGAGGLNDWNTTSPEIIRKEIIPMLVQKGEEGKRSGTLNQEQFRNFMEQVNIEWKFRLLTI